jgi:fructosamine-3-kinase
MPLHHAFVQHLDQRFTEFFKEDIRIISTAPIEGSAISQAFIVDTSRGSFFMKLNAALFGHDFFEKEAMGLATLANAGAMKVARPLFDGKFHQQIFVVMELLEKGNMDNDFWEDFGRALATQHQHSNDAFGLDYNNYIGKIPQCNKMHNSWNTFYAEERILKMVHRAHKHKLLEIEHVEEAEKICNRFSELIPEEKPALLHGDLWNGNFMVYKTGKVAIFDPAIYYGHREMDLAMSRLFGGFDTRFYQAYEEISPLHPGYTERQSLLQLYPLLVHLLLFGGHYHKEVTETLKMYR